jgi:pyridoxamine 5'-phosphate oxidase
MDNLLDYSLLPDPLSSFLQWFNEAEKVEQNAPAMAVSTYDPKKNRPNTRYLLYKGISQNQLVFYTNYLSPKARELKANQEVALAFYWHESKKQVRIHGRVAKMSLEDSTAYFHSRDRQSQIASYLSAQSAVIEDKSALLAKYNDTTKLFEGESIPLPENWGGYLVTPYEFEFFLYGENRLNDRFLYEFKKQNWEVSRLQP